MDFAKLLVLIIAILIGLNAQATETDFIYGQYKKMDLDNGFANLFIVSKDKKSDWYQNFAIEQLEEISFIFSSTCSHSHCIISVNSYNATTLESAPKIINSEDGGLSWAFKPINDIPPFFESTVIDNVFCDNEFCLGGGMTVDMNQSNSPRPILIRSMDNGQTWHYISGIPQLKPLKPVMMSTGNITCYKSVCVAAGGYEISEIRAVPFILTSIDKGVHWLMTEQIENLPAEFDGIERGGSLINNKGRFIATYTAVLKNNKTFPLIITSDDGKSWKFVSAITNLPANLYEPYLTNIECVENICITAGWYGERHQEQPFLLKSVDNGNTWVFKSTPIIYPNIFKSAKLIKVKYTEGIWVISGSYNNNNSLILISEDNGDNWAQATLQLANEHKQDALSYLNCNKAHCIAAGTNLVLFESYNQGHVWQQVILEEKISSFDSGFLMGAYIH